MLKLTNFTNFADLQGKRPAAGEKNWDFKVPKCGFYKVKWPAAGENFGVLRSQNVILQGKMSRRRRKIFGVRNGGN